MTEIDEYARRAIDSPVVPPPEMAKLVTLAGRHRRNRRGVRATLAVGLVGSVVAAIAVFSSFPPNHSSLRVTATSPKTATSTTKIGSSESHVLTIAGLTDRLTRAGLHVAADGTAPGFPLATVEHLLCVNGTQVSVYEYADTAARLRLGRHQCGWLPNRVPVAGLHDQGGDHGMDRTPTLLRGRPHHRPRPARRRQSAAGAHEHPRADRQPSAHKSPCNEEALTRLGRTPASSRPHHEESPTTFVLAHDAASEGAVTVDDASTTTHRTQSCATTAISSSPV